MKENYDWSFSPQEVRGAAAKESPLWYGVMHLGPSVDIAETAIEVGKATGLSPYQVLHVYGCRDDAIVRILRSGRNVNSPLFGLSINMKGALQYSDSPFDPAVNALEVSAYTKPPLRNCLDGVVPRNTVGHLSCYIGSVMDSVAREEGVLTVPYGLLAGRNTLIGDHPERGLIDGALAFTDGEKGELAAVPEIIANDSGTVDFSLAEQFAALEDGEYILEMHARNGASTDYAPAVARKAVTVRKAN